ncbi:MAG TPA: ATP-binding protein, partial [Luteolibacter sp.]
ELQNQTRILQSILDSMGDGVIVANQQGEFLTYNPAAQAILGVDRTGGGPERWTQHFGVYLSDEITPHPPEDLPLAKAMLGESVDSAELFVRPPGHSEGIWLNVTARPLVDQDGMVQGGVAVFSDITARRQGELEIRRLNAELEQRVLDRTRKLEAANRELEAFSYSVSHDLRAPLRALDGFSEILLLDYNDRLDDEGRGYLAHIRSAAKRMDQLIVALLQLGRVTRGELRFETFDFSSLARSVADELQESAPERAVDWVIEPDLAACGDPGMLQALLRNLLGNAWKYTSKNATARIEFGSRDEGGVRTWYVRDDGAGFDPAYSERLFEPFRRLHSSTEFEGLGVGLATVQRIIARHGGTIRAEGSPGKGATFYFTLAADASSSGSDPEP